MTRKLTNHCQSVARYSLLAIMFTDKTAHQKSAEPSKPTFLLQNKIKDVLKTLGCVNLLTTI